VRGCSATMNWKEFLKPTKWKIIPTLVIGVIVESVIYFVGATSIVCEPCPPLPAYCPPCVAPEIGLNWAVLALVPVLIVTYLATCLVVRGLSGNPPPPNDGRTALNRDRT
jgi:hypothetical protein